MARLPILFFVLLAGLITALVALLPLPVAAAEPSTGEWRGLEIGNVLTVNGYEVTVVGTANRFVRLLRIARDGRELMTSRGQAFSVYQPSLETDITASGVQHLAILGWGADGGGRDGLHDELHVLEIGEAFRSVLTLRFDFGNADLVDLDGKPGLEVEATDVWFAYNSGVSISTAGRVVMRFDGRRYVAAPDLMRGEEPTEGDVDARVKQAREELSEDALLGDVFWSTMVPWIYQGNLAKACQFYERTWQEAYVGADNVRWTYRKRFALDDFLRDVKHRGDNEGMSGLWAAIAELNGVPVDGELRCPEGTR